MSVSRYGSLQVEYEEFVHTHHRRGLQGFVRTACTALIDLFIPFKSILVSVCTNSNVVQIDDYLKKNLPQADLSRIRLSNLLWVALEETGEDMNCVGSKSWQLDQYLDKLEGRRKLETDLKLCGTLLGARFMKFPGKIAQQLWNLYQ